MGNFEGQQGQDQGHWSRTTLEAHGLRGMCVISAVVNRHNSCTEGFERVLKLLYFDPLVSNEPK